MTFTVNEHLLPTDPTKRAEAMAMIERSKKEFEESVRLREEKRKQDELIRHPPLKFLIEKLKKQNAPHIKKAMLKRIHIALTYLRVPDRLLEEGRQPTLEDALDILGRGEAKVMVLEDVARILQDFTGYHFIKVYPREIKALLDHCREEVTLARKMVWAITMNKVKEDGRYEQETKPDTGEPVPDKGQGIVGTRS